jgi:hypothetical protein
VNFIPSPTENAESHLASLESLQTALIRRAEQYPETS